MKQRALQTEERNKRLKTRLDEKVIQACSLNEDRVEILYTHEKYKDAFLSANTKTSHEIHDISDPAIMKFCVSMSIEHYANLQSLKGMSLCSGKGNTPLWQNTHGSLTVAQTFEKKYIDLGLNPSTPK